MLSTAGKSTQALASKQGRKCKCVHILLCVPSSTPLPVNTQVLPTLYLFPQTFRLPSVTLDHPQGEMCEKCTLAIGQLQDIHVCAKRCWYLIQGGTLYRVVSYTGWYLTQSDTSYRLILINSKHRCPTK